MVLSVPAPLSPAFAAAMQDALDTGEEPAASGLLLARPNQREIVAVGNRVCEQVTSQLAGIAPAAWPARTTSASPTKTGLAVTRAAVEVRAGARLAPSLVAADQGNGIVASSRSLCDALRWTVDGLVGRAW